MRRVALGVVGVQAAVGEEVVHPEVAGVVLGAMQIWCRVTDKTKRWPQHKPLLLEACMQQQTHVDIYMCVCVCVCIYIV